MNAIFRLLTALACLGAAQNPGVAFAQGRADLSAVRLETAEGGVRLTVEGDAPLTARTFFLSNPDRFVVDFPDSGWALGGASAGEGRGAGAVVRYRFAPRPNGAARLVLDLSGPAALADQGRDASGRRLNFALNMVGGAEVVTPVARAFPEPSERMRLPDAEPRRRVIVIDAGHGGHDPGALSASGIREEDVTLASARALRDALQALGGYRVILTRDGDAYLALDDRVRRAREAEADLFISLHADSNPNAQAQGASIYTLSERGANRAQAMMGNQSWNIDFGAAAPADGGVREILVDLTQRETTDRSATFAQTVTRNLEGVAPLLRNANRNAGFFVLLAPDVPAVLVEMGFLTNPEDARRLADPSQQAAFARALAAAVDEHFTAPLLNAAR
ncbi:MAG: AMIN domain-containing protein [Alphaproteobacteria bacterium]|nr:AMIN domain-containing protein [Alphaproteobacteria bacterium]